MNSKENGIKPVIKVYKTLFSTLKEHRQLILPFIYFAYFELAALIFIFIIPRDPFVRVFGPWVRTFWGEAFLHYPANFFLMPKLVSLSRMFLSIFIGSLVSGTVVLSVLEAIGNKRSYLKQSFKSASKNYISLFFIVFVITLSFYFLTKLLTIGLIKYFAGGHTKLLFIGTRAWLGPILSIISFLIALFIQSGFAYAIPFLLIEKKKIIPSVISSFKLFKKKFFATLLLVGLPMVIYGPVIVLNYNTKFLVFNVFPEFILLVSLLGIAIATLLIDPLVTIGTTILFLSDKDKK
ncbi:MAG: hypothetical protein C4533_03030 [Candidatus Omnitrophota bacterium]|jgi:hypothetical protein|nr:MAG: hypothetical protein C4533_03030 [Candidatus Omnitrophota bacterium]